MTEMLGKLITRADVEKRARNNRDAHSITTRLKSFDRRAERREYVLERIKRGKMQVPEEWGLYAIAGAKGAGKSLTMVEDLERDWTELGRAVYTNLGVEFGVQVTAMDLYTALVKMPENCTLAVDEAHQPLASLGAGSYRNTTFKQMSAGLRKKNQKVWLASSQMGGIDPGILAEVDAAFVPRNSYPGKQKARNRYGQWAFAGRRWCWISVVRIAPRPWRRGSDRLFQPYKISVDGAPPKKTIRRIEPRRVWDVSKSYDTFAPLLNPLEAGMQVSAKDIREGLESGGEWFTFGVIGEEGMPAATGIEADPAFAEYQQERDSAFISTLRQVFYRLGRKTGSVSVEFVTKHVNEFSGYPLCAPYFAEARELYKPEYGPFEFSDDDTRAILSAYTGMTGRNLSVKSFESALPPSHHWTHLTTPEYELPEEFVG